MADVFLSYSRRDSEFVRRLVASIEDQGKGVWLDTEGIADGEVFPQAIRTAIEQSDGFVFVITPASVESSYCENEVEYARQLQKRIVPVLRNPVLDSELPAEIRDRSWIPFTDQDEFESSLQRLLGALDRDLDRTKQHTRWLVKAIEWDAEGRDRSFLLRGSELKAAEAWLAASPEDAEPAPTPLQREYVLASGHAAARRQRALAGTSAAVAVVSIGLLVFALISRGQAISAQTIATSRALAAQSQNQLAVDPELSILLGMQSVRTSPTPDALFALRAAIDASPLRMTLLRPSQVNCQLQIGPSIAYDPAEPRLAEGLCGGTPGPGRRTPRGRILVFDGHDGHVMLRVDAGPLGAPALAYSPDGSELAAGVANGQVDLFDARSGRTRGVLGATSTPVPGGPRSTHAISFTTALAFSPDGSQLATVTQSQAKVWSLRRHTAVTLEGTAFPASNSIPLYSATFTRDGRAVAVAGYAGARVYEARTGALLRALPNTSQANGVAISPDGRRLAVAAFSPAKGGEGMVSLWSTRTWRPTATLASFPGRAVTAVAFRPDSTSVAIGGADGSAGLWSVQTHDQLVAYAGSTARVVAIAFAADGSQVATVSADGTTKVWHAGGPELTSINGGASIDTVRLTGNRLLAAVGFNVVRSWLMPGASPQPPVINRVPHAGSGLYTVSPDGKLSVESFSEQPGGPPTGLSINDTTTGRTVRTLAAIPATTAVAFSPDGRRLALIGAPGPEGGQPHGVRSAAIDDLTGTGTVSLQTPPGPVGRGVGGCQWVSAAISRNNGLVAGGDFCGHIAIWDAHTGRVFAEFTNRGEISQIAFSPDAPDLAVGSWDSTITIWNVQTRRAVHVLHGHTLGVNGVAYSPNGALVASSSLDHTARVWDPTTGRLLRIWRDPDPVTSVTFSSDGRRIVTGDAVGVIRIWDVCTACTNARALLTIGQRRVTRQLTSLERATYLSGY